MEKIKKIRPRNRARTPNTFEFYFVRLHDKKGVCTACRWYYVLPRHTTLSQGISIRVIKHPDIVNDPPALEKELYRIAQEKGVNAAIEHLVAVADSLRLTKRNEPIPYIDTEKEKIYLKPTQVEEEDPRIHKPYNLDPIERAYFADVTRLPIPVQNYYKELQELGITNTGILYDECIWFDGFYKAIHNLIP